MSSTSSSSTRLGERPSSHSNKSGKEDASPFVFENYENHHSPEAEPAAFVAFADAEPTAVSQLAEAFAALGELLRVQHRWADESVACGDMSVTISRKKL
jgi:hypothetical protein